MLCLKDIASAFRAATCNLVGTSLEQSIYIESRMDSEFYYKECLLQ